MDREYDNLKAEPWPLIERMTVDIDYVSLYELDAGWNERKTITKEDLIQWSVDHKVSYCIYAPFWDDPNVVLQISTDYDGLLISAIVHKVHCKAGITLKSPFDIAELFFEDYNPDLIKEWERKSYYFSDFS